MDMGTGHAKLFARIVLLATGVRWDRLECPGIESVACHYVCNDSTAGTCRNADVAIVGAGNSAGQAAMYLAECGPNRVIHLIVRKMLGPGMSDYLVQRIRFTQNILVHEHSIVARVEKGRVILSRPDGIAAYDIAAVFPFIGAKPIAREISDVGLNSDGYVLVGDAAVEAGWPLASRMPQPLETTIPRILAAGDGRAGATRRMAFAAGDGALAVVCTHRLLAMQRIKDAENLCDIERRHSFGGK